MSHEPQQGSVQALNASLPKAPGEAPDSASEAGLGSSETADTKSLPVTGNGCQAHVLQEGSWSPRFWANSAHVAIRFDSPEQLDAAIDWLWAAPEMRDLPRVHVGDNTMIVPAAAVEHFRSQGHRFTIRKVVSAGELPSEEVNRIRAQRKPTAGVE